MGIPTQPGMVGFLTAITSITCVASFFALIPYLNKQALIKARKQGPNLVLFFIALTIAVLNIGFLILAYYKGDPSSYVDPITGTSAICTVQAILLVNFGLVSLFLLFSYMFLLHQSVVNEKPQSTVANMQMRMVIGSNVAAGLLCIVGPFIFPFIDSTNPSHIVVFGTGGPWCSPKNILYLTVSFYVPGISLAIATIIMAIRVILKVRRTTKAANSQTKSTFTGFYLRISVFSLFYCAATIGAGIKRAIEVSKPGLFDVHHLDPATNDPTIGVSILLPLLALIESIIILTTPFSRRFYGEFIYNYTGFGKSQSRVDTDKTTDKTTDKFDQVGSFKGIVSVGSYVSEKQPLSQ